MNPYATYIIQGGQDCGGRRGRPVSGTVGSARRRFSLESENREVFSRSRAVFGEILPAVVWTVDW